MFIFNGEVLDLYGNQESKARKQSLFKSIIYWSQEKTQEALIQSLNTQDLYNGAIISYLENYANIFLSILHS